MMVQIKRRSHFNGVGFARQSMATDMEALNNKPFFLLLNLAVGGNWPGSPSATTEFPQHFKLTMFDTLSGVGRLNAGRGLGLR